VVVEGQVHARHVGQVRRDVAAVSSTLPSWTSFGVDEQHVVEDAEVLEQRGAHEPVEVAARHEAVRSATPVVIGSGLPEGHVRLLVSARAGRP
jgi:hypothetical protein